MDEVEFTRRVRNWAEPKLGSAPAQDYADRIWGTLLSSHDEDLQGLGEVHDAEGTVLALCPSVEAAEVVEKLLAWALENYPFVWPGE